MALQQLTSQQIGDDQIKDVDVSPTAAIQLSKIYFNSHFIPAQDNVQSVGSLAYALRYLHTKVLRTVSASVPVDVRDGDIWLDSTEGRLKLRDQGTIYPLRNSDQGTISTSFILNMANSSGDTQSSFLYFERGIGYPDASLSWNHVSKMFNLSNNLVVGIGEAIPSLSFPGIYSQISNAASLKIIATGTSDLTLESTRDVFLKDGYMSLSLPMTETGERDLSVGGHAISLIGALNYLYDHLTDAGTLLERDFTASVALSPGVAVYLSGADSVAVADATDVNKARVIGVTRYSALPGGLVRVVFGGHLPGMGVGWVSDDAVFLSQSTPGALTQSISYIPNTSITQLGYATSASDFIVDISDPFLL